MATVALKVSQADYDRLSRDLEHSKAIKIPTEPGKFVKTERFTDNNEYLFAYCCQIHALIHTILEVPDEKDAEIRIIVGEDENGDEIKETSVDVMYTIGDNEYPGFKGKETFRPDEPKMFSLWSAIKQFANLNRFDFGVKEALIQAWENSTFIWRDGEEWSKFCDTTAGGPQEADDLKESVELVIYMTEEMRNALRKRGGGSPEQSRSIEEEFPLVGDFAQATREKLGIKESGVESERKLNCRIVVSEFADVGVGVEVRTTDTLSRARQQALAEELKNAFENNEVTKNPEVGVEVWIKQGEATMVVGKGVISIQ